MHGFSPKTDAIQYLPDPPAFVHPAQVSAKPACTGHLQKGHEAAEALAALRSEDEVKRRPRP